MNCMILFTNSLLSSYYILSSLLYSHYYHHTVYINVSSKNYFGFLKIKKAFNFDLNHPIFFWFSIRKTHILPFFSSKNWPNYRIYNPITTKMHLQKSNNNHRDRWQLYWINYLDQNLAQKPTNWPNLTTFRPR